MKTLLILLLLFHLLGDFYMQCDDFCKAKNDKGFLSWQLYVHALIMAICTWLANPTLSFVWPALIIGVSHLVIDGLKSYLKNWRYAFWIDQLLHIVLLVCVSYWYRGDASCFPISDPDMFRYIVLATSVLFLLKPTNIIINQIFKEFKLQLGVDCNTNESLVLAGHVIGGVERLMVFVFVMLGEYEAIGFLIAAKSILRFKETDTARTEYVLVGTLLSFMLAIMVALITKYVI